MIQGVLCPVVRASAIACLLGMSQSATAQSVDGPLAFEVLPTSQRVTVGSPIELTFRVRNAGTQSALANRRFYLNETVWLKITAPSGEEVEWCGRITDRLVRQDDYAILMPGAQVKRTARISCDAKRIAGYEMGAMGEYVVTARYKLGLPMKALKAIAQDAFVTEGWIEAPPVHVEVVAPPPATGVGKPTQAMP